MAKTTDKNSNMTSFHGTTIRASVNKIGEPDCVCNDGEEAKQKTFTISVVRVGYANKNIDVEADNLKEAEELALKEAGDYEFSEHTSDYFVEDENPNDKFIIYLNSDDSECLEYDDTLTLKNQILEHSEHEVYTIDNFALAFNNERISDLGYIIVVSKNELKEWNQQIK